ncbi:MAG TPA: hypothetical protein VNU71_07075 [Burkholderiaceae bacterium]|nr:hypothetical protein [Burkholderiaceae bacterium]
MATATHPIPGTGATPAHPRDGVERLYREVTWRLIPFLFICYVASYLGGAEIPRRCGIAVEIEPWR